MKKALYTLAAALVLGTFGSSAARATPVDFSFAFTGQVNGSGVFVTNPTTTAGEYLITGISGTVAGSAITSLLAPGTYPLLNPPANDNLLFAPPVDGGSFDLAGVSFMNASGNLFNAYYDGAVYGVVTGPTERVQNIDTFTVRSGAAAVTPEPSSFVLLGTGALASLGMLRRRFSF